MVSNVFMESNLFFHFGGNIDKVVAEAIKRCKEQRFLFSGIDIQIGEGDGGGFPVIPGLMYSICAPNGIPDCIHLYSEKLLDEDALQYGIIEFCLVYTRNGYTVVDADRDAILIDFS